MSQTVIQIPINRLSASSLNVRRKDRKADIDALAASILAHGLLQNLNVIAKDEDRYEVVAGGRRLAALKALAKTGAIPRDYPVSCRVLECEQAREASLAENIQRVEMDAIDEVEAYGYLVEEGATPELVARRFGVTLRHVQQRLALSKLSAKIKAGWKRGEVTLEAARAFCLVEDHAQQDAVYRSLGKPITHASTVRSRLMGDRMRGNDRLAVFVGLEVYEAAGGVLVRDLFDEEAVFISDPALMTRLAEQKLEGLRESYVAAGWGWTDLNLSGGQVPGARIYPDWREHTAEEDAELVRLRTELDALDEALEADSVENDPRWDRRDELAGAIEIIRQAARVWDPELMPLAGVVLSLGHDGDLDVVCGVVRPSDEKAIRDVRKSRTPAGSVQNAPAEAGGTVEEDAPASGLPRPVIRDLSLARTRAIRLALIRSPDAALAVAVAAMLSRSRLHASLPGIAISAHEAVVDDLDAAHAVMSETEAQLDKAEEDVLAWCLAQPRDGLLRVLTLLTARAIDLSHEKGSPSDRDRQSMADALCRALGIDMRETWQPDTAFWLRLPKAELTAALELAPSVVAMTTARRTEFLKASGKLKKDALAAKVEAAYAGAHYLPDLFVTASKSPTSPKEEARALEAAA